MTTKNEIKIKKLLDEHVPGTVMAASWLKSKSISHDLQKHYRRNGWIESVGTGAFKRPKENITWKGGLYALQKQLSMPVHAGGLTALSLSGFSHYLRLGDERIYLFTPLKSMLPAWFRNYSWGNPIEHISTSFLPDQLSLQDQEELTFTIRLSTAERAILEYLYLTPRHLDMMEGYQVLSGLSNLRPGELQNLLEQCTSVKVKRLFLYMSEKAGHQWFTHIDQSVLDLGKGDRSLVDKGVYISTYRITVPRQLFEL